MLQVGFFIFFNLLAFGFLGYALSKNRSLFGDVLFMFAMILFFALGFYMLPVEDIGTQITIVSNSTNEQFTETHVFIEDRETFYLVYVYWGMAMLSFILLMLGKFKKPAKNDGWGES